MKTSLFIGIFCLSLLATPIQWEYSNGGNNHWYDVIMLNDTWDNAKDHAETQVFMNETGHLATITSSEEQTFINESILFPNDLVNISSGWIGAIQTSKSNEPSGNWSWITGEEWVYTNWVPGEPNNTWNNEEHINIRGNTGKWNDEQNNYRMPYYIIEYDNVTNVPEPNIVLMHLLCLLLLSLTTKVPDIFKFNN